MMILKNICVENLHKIYIKNIDKVVESNNADIFFNILVCFLTNVCYTIGKGHLAQETKRRKDDFKNGISYNNRNVQKSL